MIRIEEIVGSEERKPLTLFLLARGLHQPSSLLQLDGHPDARGQRRIHDDTAHGSCAVELMHGS